MQQCPKCAKVYAEDLKICRTCGSILEPYKKPNVAPKEKPEPEAELLTAANVVEDSSPEEESPAADPNIPQPDWVCLQCKKTVPGNFDICWNCFTTRDGQFDPEFAKIAAAADIAEDQDDEEELLTEDDAEEIKIEHPIEKPSPKRENSFCCPRCGSDKIIRGARAIDRRENFTGDLTVAVYGDPEAIFFKDSLYGTLSADICGHCGHVEFRVDNPAELWEHYRKSKH